MAGEYLDPRQWYTWMDSLNVGPQRRAWPQDLYTSRLRKIQQENPAPWSQDDMDTAVKLGMSTVFPGGLLARGMMAAPKIATGLGAAYGLLAGTDAAGEVE